MSPRDISGRVLSRPLSNPYVPGGGKRPRSRWILLAAVAWLLWAGVLSDHSLWRIYRLRHELASDRIELARVRTEATKLETRLNDPDARVEHAEGVLRQQGMARPGEIIYRLGGGRADTATTQPAPR